MIYLLVFLVPIVALLVWAVMFDRKQRRHGDSGHDIESAARRARLDAEGRGQPGN